MINKNLVLVLFILSSLGSYSQDNLTFTKSIPLTIKANKAYKEVIIWFDGQTRFRNITVPESETNIKGTGIITYRNPIKYPESSALSKVYQAKTNGKFIYDINIDLIDNACIITLSNFKHEPDDKIDNFNFGILTLEDKIPTKIFCEVTPEWCNNVWLDMKSRIEQQVNTVFLSLPQNL